MSGQRKGIVRRLVATWREPFHGIRPHYVPCDRRVAAVPTRSQKANGERRTANGERPEARGARRCDEGERGAGTAPYPVSELEAVADDQLPVQMRASHGESGEAYGSPRIWRALRERGHRVGRERVRRLMQRHGIVARHRRWRFVRTTVRDPATMPAPNMLARNFVCDVSDRVWLGDARDPGRRDRGGGARHGDRASGAAAGLGRAYRSRRPVRRAPVHRRPGEDPGRAEHVRHGQRVRQRAAAFAYIETFYYPVRMRGSFGYRSPNRYEQTLRTPCSLTETWRPGKRGNPNGPEAPGNPSGRSPC